MTRDPGGRVDPEKGPPDGDGRLRTTSPALLGGTALVGLVLGWALRPVSVELGWVAPRVGWVQVSALYAMAAVIAVAAWATRSALAGRRGELRAYQAVNRLVLAKACAIAAALVTGGYLGYAFSWVGLEAELAGERAIRSLVAAGGALLSVICSLLLERACRVRSGGSES